MKKHSKWLSETLHRIHKKPERYLPPNLICVEKRKLKP